MEDQEDQEERFEKKCLYLRISFWETFLLWLTVFTFSVMLGGLATPRWVQQGSDASLWKGSILQCGGCSGEWEDLYYSEISSIASENNVNGYYLTFNSLAKAGTLYAIFECIGLLCISIVLLFQSKIWFKSAHPRIINSLLIGLLISHTIAIFSWFFITNARFFNDCSICSDYTKAYDICPNQGPVLSIASEVGIIFVIIATLFLSSKKKSGNRILAEAQVHSPKVY